MRDWIPGWRATACRRLVTKSSQSFERVSASPRRRLDHLLESIEHSPRDLVLVPEMTEDGSVLDADFMGELCRGELPQTPLSDDLDGSVGDFTASFFGRLPDGHMIPLASKYLLAIVGLHTRPVNWSRWRTTRDGHRPRVFLLLCLPRLAGPRGLDTPSAAQIH